MSKQYKKSRVPIFIALLAIPVLFFYQNCSKVRVQVADLASVEKFATTSCDDVNSKDCDIKAAVCEFNGVEVADGSSVLAYLTSTVEEGSSCQSESRFCSNGSLSGSFNFESCQINIKKSCLFDGREIRHGDFAEAFANSTVAFGETCMSEKRYCTDGVLSGNNHFGSCAVGAPQACFYNGKTVKHLESVIAFAESSVPFGSICNQESRTCINGVMSGSFAYANCSAGAPKSCLFSGQTLAHGQSVTAFEDSSVAFGSTCKQENRTCNNGVISGSYTNSNCKVNEPKACAFNGEPVAHGQSVTAFEDSSVAFGSTCKQENRTCNNGVISGSYTNSNCKVNEPSACVFNGQPVAHGQSVIGFLESSVAFGQSCQQEKRVCSNGVISGSYQFASCEVGAPKSCLIGGQTVAHGQSAVAYSQAVVPFGSSCQSELRSCSNGVATGSFNFSSCEVTAPKVCSFNGQTLAHGQSVEAFAPPVNNVCAKETRTCNNGVLPGSYTSTKCDVVVAGPADGGNLCGQFRNVQGDMRVYIEPSKAADQDSILEFGTFADNYWEGSQKLGKQYSRKLTFEVQNKAKIFSMVLSQASFDDWLSIKVNGKAVYFGPKDGADRMIYDAVNGRVQYSATKSDVVELSTSWNRSLNIDLAPYLIEGQNTIETDTIVAGGGESALKIKYRSDCKTP